MPSVPRVAVWPPDRQPWAGTALDAISAGGGVVVDPAEANALVWTAIGHEAGGTPSDLASVLHGNPGIGWVQLPWAGVEPYADAGIFDHDHVWTCAKGIYAQPVAEHAMALALAGLRHLKRYGQARHWTDQAATSLLEGNATIFGGGGITRELVGLLAPWRCRITVVRKHPDPMPGVDRVVGWEKRDQVLGQATAVILALALTPETFGFFGANQLSAMSRDGVLVNVARGQHVVTDALVDALASGQIAGAGLDVTDPEPLPEGHPLWSEPNCLITPHTANPRQLAAPLLGRRIAENVRRFAAGEPLEGLIDPDLGY